MRNKGDALINRAAEFIVIFSSLLIIALMVTGGCNNGGHDGPTDSPSPTPLLTGFPPECDGTFGVDLSCPAASLAGSICLPYFCDVIDDSVSPAEVVDTVTVVFGDHCSDTDCFTLDCQDISVLDADFATIIIESLNGTPVGEDAMGVVDSGLPDGRIIIGGEEFLLDCNGYVVP
jgi:hypothetical protein